MSETLQSLRSDLVRAGSVATAPTRSWVGRYVANDRVACETFYDTVMLPLMAFCSGPLSASRFTLKAVCFGRMLETSVLGLGQDLGLLLVLEGAMTNSTYVSRFSFILIPYRFKVRDRGGRLIIMEWKKIVFSRIAKDVVGKGPDHGTFVLRLSSKRMLNSGWEAGSLRWMGDGSILSVRKKTGWKDGEDGRLAVPFNPI
ncbi:hypothetical protein DY000_02006689 [Brassica cretica]|uniref:Uncharacterized protein n=1 Tax=Brassica cretica TaxID=69181 RepID=A0ABQ7C0U2_BRACR|nr:hypothetical protein DY000_02006689 [Brassica cretica]